MVGNIKIYILICILIIIFIINELYIKETMISHKVNNKEFKVYDKFQNYRGAADILYEIDNRIHKLFKHLNDKYILPKKQIDEVLKKRLVKMISTYKTHHLKENFPAEHLGIGKKPDSSFTLNKKNMSICLRDDESKKFHDINDIMFVVIHEMSHILNPTYGHPRQFWIYMKFLLHESAELGIYNPVDYRNNNIKYCNTNLTANPYFNKMECNIGIPHTCY